MPDCTTGKPPLAALPVSAPEVAGAAPASTPRLVRRPAIQGHTTSTPLRRDSESAWKTCPERVAVIETPGFAHAAWPRVTTLPPGDLDKAQSDARCAAGANALSARLCLPHTHQPRRARSLHALSGERPRLCRRTAKRLRPIVIATQTTTGLSGASAARQSARGGHCPSST